MYCRRYLSTALGVDRLRRGCLWQSTRARPSGSPATEARRHLTHDVGERNASPRIELVQPLLDPGLLFVGQGVGFVDRCDGVRTRGEVSQLIGDTAAVPVDDPVHRRN